MPPLFKNKVGRLYDQDFETANTVLDDMKTYSVKIADKAHDLLKDLADPNKTALNKAELLAEASNRSAQRVPDSPYATILICVTDSERKKATLQRALVTDVTTFVVIPLREWVKGECCEIMKARDDLKRKRSALDSAVKNAEKAKNASSKPGSDDIAAMADRKLADAQAAHDTAKNAMDEFLAKLPAYQTNHELIIKTLMKLLQTYATDAAAIEKQYIGIAKSDVQPSTPKSAK